MNTRKNQLRIAQLCGLDVSQCSTHHQHECCGRPRIPDYFNDLNACALFEAFLRKRDRALYWTYGKKLDGIVARYNSHDSRTQEECIGVFEASAGQRCEAFLFIHK